MYRVLFYRFHPETFKMEYAVYQDCRDDDMPPDPFEMRVPMGYTGFCLVTDRDTGQPYISSDRTKVEAAAVLLELPDA